MARIQILELPSVVVGEVVETPFALIVDEAEGAFDDVEFLSAFKEACGARAIGVFAGTINLPANV